MEENYKYFIEDSETNEWYWFGINDLDIRNHPVEYPFTKDPHKAFGFMKKEHAQDCIDKGMITVGADQCCIKNSQFYKENNYPEIRNLVVTEHEFIS